MIPAKILERKPRLRFNFEEGTFSKTNETFHGKRGWKMENTGFYVIPNKTQYEIGERVWLEIKKTGPTKANHVKVSLFTYQGENLEM